jgi:uncharacterized membrane protein
MNHFLDKANNSESRVAQRAAIFVWAVISFLSLVVVALIVAAPLALAQNHLDFASAIYRTFSYACHQISERSFHLAGHQFAVCSRCTGLYAGFAFATLGYPIVRSLKQTDTPRIIWLILSTIPLAIDFSLTYFGVWENNHLSRFVTGGLLGAVAALFVVPGLIDLALTVRRKFRSEPSA